ncbi:hypothetical protein [Streptomyces sp. NPDC059979]|uniref:hypothetical protein n=1 Tax=Streptomyces sp. NPDC059979 TaxID=3347021 RepID=UPI003677691D
MAWTLELGELDAVGEEIVQELKRITTLDGKLPFPVSHQVTARESQTEWGASGSFGQYMLELSVNYGGGLGAVGTVEVIKAAFKAIRLRSSHPAEQDPLSSDDARALIRRHLSLHFEVPAEQLTESYCESSSNGQVHTFSFVAADGVEYGGTVGGPDEPDQCTKVWRKSGEARFRYGER